MKRINFERFEIYNGVAHKDCTVIDAREGFADIIYRNGSGVRCADLAMKIFKSSGETEYAEEDVELMKRFATEYCSVALADSFGANIKEYSENTTKEG